MGCSKEGKIKSAPAYTIIGRAKPLKSLSANFPGPGMYDGNFELLIKKPPQYSMGDRVGKTNNKFGPGPGAHSPEKV